MYLTGHLEAIMGTCFADEKQTIELHCYSHEAYKGRYSGRHD